jgi:hypothetical protein
MELVWLVVVLGAVAQRAFVWGEIVWGADVGAGRQLSGAIVQEGNCHKGGNRPGKIVLEP